MMLDRRGTLIPRGHAAKGRGRPLVYQVYHVDLPRAEVNQLEMHA